MMIKHFLTICTAATAAAAGTSLVQAQQSYQVQQAPGYSTQYPQQQGYPSEYRPGDRVPNFDAFDDDDDAMPPPQQPRNSAGLPPPGPSGPIMSPDDPRYGRPAGAPVYSNAPQGPVVSPDDPRYGRPAGAPVYSNAPQGPVMSPDDPRYGRPAGPPAVIYADRPPQQGVNDGLRPPEAVGGPTATGAVPQQQQPAIGADGKPMSIAALPPEEQPDAAPVQLSPNLRRQEVAFQTKEPAGTLVVDTPNTYLYYVLGGGRAIRYGVRVGRDGFTWTGVQKITRKAEWPDWHPPTEMIERQPYLPRFMAGGPGNPLGARAMYLGSTVYRIHGTNQPSTIGKFVSSGCIGMLNEDVSDLFDRVKVGTRVVVMPGGPPPGTATASAAPTPGGPATAQMAPPVPGMQPTVVPPLPAPVTVR
ncbi:L,D-transpeptidase family protein [Bradyrhizobium manausense]|uniref:L,D-transpeptidase family protein n=1 Tax=Bradyrhizobium TaxID=374 RepID=UPI001BA54935|nr:MULTISPECIES: L,D-transpeptidase [Bradyrhizobium]MBR0830689.1 L,D-transpeptidase family protein [Bradyrhizobium manausense]UVO31068.1 L,D-transpeptidase family protein [Bradyrhizobium arachidis]